MENNPKTQVIERLKEAQNVLITVSNNPSVDQLSAAIGFTLMMNKLGKHATAVFSGEIPSTLEFLKPEDTLETNTDSLRDFIISLDKAKADKLRYKVEENVVKIFITPYKTSLSDKDLDFSQGDFNVDVVVALGVDQRDHIDQAIMAHGRILHDATVIGVMAGQAPLDVGSINWQEPAASSLCEMLVSISEAFQSGLLDGQMATAYLTGIVAETDRFSNEKTSPKVMTMSAQLMAAGANQQLIATELMPVQEEEIAVPVELPAPAEPQPEPEIVPAEPQSNPDEGEISLHEPEPAPEPAKEEPEQGDGLTDEEREALANQIRIDEQGVLLHADELGDGVSDIQIKNREGNVNRGKVIEPPVHEEFAQKYSTYMTEAPKIGGTLTANSEPEALDPSTDPLSAIPQGAFPAPDYSQAAKALTTDTSPEQESDFDAKASPDPHLGPNVSPDETLADIEKSVHAYAGTEEPDTINSSTDTARQAVLDAVTATGDFDPNRPDPLQSVGSQPLQESNQSAPPSVPPPFPMPDEDGNLPPLT